MIIPIWVVKLKLLQQLRMGLVKRYVTFLYAKVCLPVICGLGEHAMVSRHSVIIAASRVRVAALNGRQPNIR